MRLFAHVRDETQGCKTENKLKEKQKCILYTLVTDLKAKNTII